MAYAPGTFMNQLKGWTFLVFNSPLLGFWLLQIIVVVAGIRRGISHPSELFAIAGTIGTLHGITRNTLPPAP